MKARYSTRYVCGVFLLAAMPGSVGQTPSSDTRAALQASPVKVAPEAVLPVSLPMQTWNRLPVVDVGVNTSLIERFVVDTGLNANVVRTDAVTRLQLSALPSKVRVSVLDTSCESPEAQIKTLKLRGLQLQEVPVATADVPALLSLQPHPDAPTGWLGGPFLSAFQITFDFAAHSLTLDKPQTTLHKAREAVTVPLVIKEGRPFVKVSIPGAKPFLALVDTGSPGTLIPTEIAEKLKIKPLKIEPFKRPDGKEGKAALIVVPKLNVGKAEWKGGQVASLTADSPKEFDHTLATLGLNFLTRYKVTLNYARQQMTLTPPGAPETKEPEKTENDSPEGLR